MLRPDRSQLLLMSASALFCAGGLLAGEWAVRTWPPDRIRLSPARSAIVHSRVYGWQLRARWTQRDEAGHQVSTDQAGRRVQAAGTAAAGAMRVAILGDSVAFGTGVDDLETFASLLSSREGWTVANFAVPGWGIDQSLLRYENEVRAWRPSAVVLNVCLANDLADSMLTHYLYDPAWPKPYFTIEDGRLRRHEEHLVRSRTKLAWLWLWEHSHLLSLVASRGGEAAHPELGHWMGRRKTAVKDEDTASRLAVLQLLELRDATRADGAAFLVVLHPDRAAFEERSPLAARLRGDLTATGLPALDLAARYRDAGWSFSDLTLDGLGHLSPRGHAVAEREIRDALAGGRPSASTVGAEGAAQR
ncbi:MAG TPA: SGNH/GDSL hydrolase family protein [Vicinamibacteria bacterium]|nr:SGNH/GDSL hydrolase family protein [Vicinamibacteria bacterium]